MNKKIGLQSLRYANPPVILTTASIAGKMEGEGKLKDYYDKILPDNLNGHDSWEKCESSMLEWAITTAITKGGLSIDTVDCILAGDLLNQLTATHFALRNLNRPFLGLYGACSTLAESMLLGSVLIDGGYAENVAVAVSSHHDTAERQYRFPTEQGVQRPPMAQWTVTGSGSVLLSHTGSGPKVTYSTIGKIVDFGVKDPNEMGAAMAPAAADTIYQHFIDTGTGPHDYDRIFTGDLGKVGKELTIHLLAEKRYEIQQIYEDCGCLIYKDEQDTHSGASGCASSALAFCGYIINELIRQNWHRILFVGTGCLHSTTSYQQKESIPCIAHAVVVEN